MKLNNKVERLKTVAKLPTPKLSVKFLRKEFQLEIAWLKAAKNKKDKSTIFRHNFLDDMEYENITYQYSMQVSIYVDKESNKVKIKQLPLCIFINKNDYSEDCWIFYKGTIPCAYWQEAIARKSEPWKQYSAYRPYRFQNFYYSDDKENELLELKMQIPYFKKYYNGLLEKHLEFRDFVSAIKNWNVDKLLETSLKENWIVLYTKLFHTKGTLSQRLKLENEDKHFVRRVINKYGNVKGFNINTFSDTLKQVREGNNEFSEEDLFQSFAKVEEIHRFYIDKENKLKDDEKAKVEKRLKQFKKYIKGHKAFKKEIEVVKPTTKKELKDAGTKMDNCIGTYHPKDIYIIHIKDWIVGVEWTKTQTKPQQILTYKNNKLPDNWNKAITNKIKEVHNEPRKN